MSGQAAEHTQLCVEECDASWLEVQLALASQFTLLPATTHAQCTNVNCDVNCHKAPVTGNWHHLAPTMKCLDTMTGGRTI